MTIEVSKAEENMDNMEEARVRMEKDALAHLLGIKIVEMRPGYAQVTMPVTASIVNGLGVTAGGAVFSLADIAFAAASNAHGIPALALSVNIHFLKGTKEGNILTAVAREENRTRKTGLYRIEVREDDGTLVALAEGLAYRKPG